MDAPADVIRRPASPRLARLISGISFYRERGLGLAAFRHAAPLTLPLLVNLGTPFRIALGHRPDTADARPSFAAGLFPGPVVIESDGRAECVQVDFTPLGAYRFFCGAVPDLTARIVGLADVLGRDGENLRARVAEATGWQRRFEIVEDFVLRRAVHEPSPAVAFALERLWCGAGAVRIADIAADIGWSRKHLTRRFHDEIGMPPKTLAQMLRFHRACALARMDGAGGWAAIAADAGYADQAHLSREFRIFSGETPAGWAARLDAVDPRLMREGGG